MRCPEHTFDPTCQHCVAARSVTLRSVLSMRHEARLSQVRARITVDDGPEALMDAIAAASQGSVE